MLIDWFTVAAQIVNFLILVWLLKRFLYGRILRAIDAREAGIAARIADTEAKEKAATEEAAEYRAKLLDIEQQHDAMLAAARADAAAQQAVMVEKARDAVAAIETKWREDLERERQEFLVELRRRAASEVVLVVRRVISDLACMDVQQCAAQVFLKKLRLVDDASLRSFADSELSVCCALELPEQLQRDIRETIQARLGSATPLRFVCTPELGIGLELRANGWRIGWNSATYLEALEEDVKQAFEHGVAESPAAEHAAV